MNNKTQITLSLNPSKDNLEQLLRIQYFLVHSLSHAKKNTSVDRMIAIHGLDNVNEYILKFIVDVLDIEEKTGCNFKDSELKNILGQVSKFLKSEHSIFIPYTHDIKSLRQIRNLVQHNGLDPNISDLNKYCQAVEKFFFKIIKILFNLERKDLRFSSIVKDKEIKELILDIENNIESSNYLEAVISCRDAFENAQFKRLENTSLHLTAAPAQIEANKTEYIKYFFQNITDELFINSNGINLNTYKKFKDYINYIPLEFTHESSAGILNRDWEKQDADFCYNFVVNTILQWELEELPEIHNPPYSENTSEKVDWEEFLAGVELGESGCIYSGSNLSEFRLFYINEKCYKSLDLKSWEPKNIEEFVSIQKADGEIKRKSTYQIKIKGFHYNLLTNNPPRWSFIFHYENVHFGRKVEEIVGGELKCITKSLNESSIEDIANSLKCFSDKDNSAYIEKSTNIVNHIKTNGPLKTPDEVKNLMFLDDSDYHSLSFDFSL